MDNGTGVELQGRFEQSNRGEQEQDVIISVGNLTIENLSVRFSQKAIRRVKSSVWFALFVVAIIILFLLNLVIG